MLMNCWKTYKLLTDGQKSDSPAQKGHQPHWYGVLVPQTPNERIKVTVYITDSQLRADALRVNMFKQVRKGNDWVNVTPDSATSIDIENIILSQARRLKIKATES